MALTCYLISSLAKLVYSGRHRVKHRNDYYQGVSKLLFGEGLATQDSSLANLFVTDDNFISKHLATAVSRHRVTFKMSYWPMTLRWLTVRSRPIFPDQSSMSILHRLLSSVEGSR